MLDGIRGTAVLLVIVHHLVRSLSLEFKFGSAAADLLAFGWAGVDLFFVLSGFLITGILVDSKGERNYFTNFYMRRVLRIFPLYFGVLAGVAIILVMLPGARPYLGEQNLVWQWLYATNIVISMYGWDSFGILTHYWSLAVEEHFYLIWPFVVYSCSRKSLIRVASAVCVAAFVVRLILVLKAEPAAAYVFTPSRMDALACGGLLAILIRQGYKSTWFTRLSSTAGVVAIMGLAIIGVSRQTFSHDDSVMQTIGFSLLMVAFASLIALSVLAPATSIRSRLFGSQALRALGKYSYGLYVFHPVIFIFFFHSGVGRALRLSKLTGISVDPVVDALFCCLVACAVTAGVTLASWNLWEKKFLNLKHLFASPNPPRLASPAEELAPSDARASRVAAAG